MKTYRKQKIYVIRKKVTEDCYTTTFNHAVLHPNVPKTNARINFKKTNQYTEV